MPDTPKAKQPKKPSLFRGKYLYPTIIVAVLLVVFNFFLLDRLMKWGLIATGELAFGAKVEIAALDFRISKLSLAIRGLQVADKDKPMSNLIEVDALQGAILPGPLFSKKFIIPNMSVTGLRWGTARKASGALPPKRRQASASQTDSLTSKLASKLRSRAESEWKALPAWDNIEKAKAQIQNVSADKLVNPNELASLKEIENLKQENLAKADAYQAKLKSLDIQPKIDSLKAAINDVKAIKISNAQDAAAAGAKIEALRKQMAEVQGVASALQSLKADADKDFGRLAGLRQRLDDIKNKDFQAVAGKLQLPSLSTDGLLRALVGSTWMGNVEKIVGYSNLARKYFPAKKKSAAPAVKPRLHGLDVSFPAANRPPDFHIVKMSLSGTTGGEGKSGTPLDFSGEITDITSDPALVGRPIKAEFKGSQGGRQLALTAVIDHTQEIPKESLLIALQGLEAAGLKLPQSDYLPSFQRGQVAAKATFSLMEEQLASALDLQFSRLGAPGAAAGGSGEAGRLVAELWKGIDGFQAGVNIHGNLDRLQMDVTSDLDKLLSARLQAMVGKELAALQQKIMAQINQATAEAEKQVMAQGEKLKAQLMAQLGDKQKLLQEQIQAGQNASQQKQNAAQQAADEQKKKAEEQLKKGAEDQFKKLFNK